MHGYEHTQPGTFIRILIGVSLLAVGAIVIAVLAAGYPRKKRSDLACP